MKALINKTSKVAYFLWDDSTVITLKEDLIEVGNPLEYRITDQNSLTCEVVTGVTEPTKFKPGKYQYKNNEWVDNVPTDDGRTYTWTDEGGGYWSWEDEANNPPTEQYRALYP